MEFICLSEMLFFINNTGGTHNTGSRSGIKMLSYHCKKSHCEDQASWLYYLYNGISHTDDTASFCWNRLRVPI